MKTTKTQRTQRQKGKHSPYASVTQANTKIQTGLKKKKSNTQAAQAYQSK
jgi:hypothetical protein